MPDHGVVDRRLGEGEPAERLRVGLPGVGDDGGHRRGVPVGDHRRRRLARTGGLRARYPTRWFVRSTPYACAGFAFDQELALPPGEALDLRYRVVIAEGPGTPSGPTPWPPAGGRASASPQAGSEPYAPQTRASHHGPDVPAGTGTSHPTHHARAAPPCVVSIPGRVLRRAGRARVRGATRPRGRDSHLRGNANEWLRPVTTAPAAVRAATPPPELRPAGGGAAPRARPMPLFGRPVASPYGHETRYASYSRSTSEDPMRLRREGLAHESVPVEMFISVAVPQWEIVVTTQWSRRG